MNEKFKIPVNDTLPSLEAVLNLQGVPSGAELQAPVINAAKSALQLYLELAAPVALTSSIRVEQFEPIFNGIGLNESPNPIEKIYPRATRLTLFAATVGPAISARISKLFAEGEFPLAGHLDSAASNGADLISTILEKMYKSYLIRLGLANKETVVMAYSPGYCGWHISAQKALFEFLHPGEIGISLRDSFLMEPLKSITGVLIAGPRSIHKFEASYAFCARCKAQSCLDRTDAQDKE
jgi:hypothetical protein